MKMNKLLPTAVVGSYPQPHWLVDDAALSGRVPRVRAQDIWRIDEEQLVEAQDDATRIAIQDMERAGVDIITDGEIRRESYSNHFATALQGIDLDNPGETTGRSGQLTMVPRVVGEIVRPQWHTAQRRAVSAQQHNKGSSKRPCPGPFTMSQQVQNDYYPDGESLAHWRTPRSCAKRWPICLPPAPTLCNSMSRGCRRVPMRRGNTRSRR